ncbi:conserved hypothetical protein [Burkholderia sp. 8Y]|uniref:DUF1840 domain-containing protein n=1 Tax=Burkholderia sp. 8Y TaxID=2653133 RepID=UPI0012F1F51A|nr:DUF1840 domain-containing protein [Burkholderia sp. 8Y]VXB34589.1 conserved hypothetical protein [Burkholderia sp. 8Y]
MLVTFHSRATPDVVMLRDLAGYLLGIIGKRIGSRGVILHSEVDAAIERLQTVLNEDERIAHEHGALYHPLSLTDERTGLGLQSRALPFLDMLREARLRDADIIWGL